MAALVGRWWNGSWGTMSRRDIWLTTDGVSWHVRARERGENGRHLTWPPFPTEHDARAWVRHLIATTPGRAQDWRDLTAAVQRQRPADDSGR